MSFMYRQHKSQLYKSVIHVMAQDWRASARLPNIINTASGQISIMIMSAIPSSLFPKHWCEEFVIKLAGCCRIDEKNMIKVADFGLSENVYSSGGYVCQSNEEAVAREEKVPIR